MKVRSILILVGAAAALWGAWFFWLGRTAGSDERREEAARLLPGLDVPRVEKIEIDGPHGAVALERRGADWRIGRPIDDAADGETVRTLLRALAFAKAETRLGRDEVQGGEEATGFARGVGATLTLGGATRALRVGAAEAPGGRRYAEVAGDDSYAVVPGELFDLLDRPADDLRDKRLVPASSKEIARFTIARAGAAAATFARDGAEGWRFEEGGGAAADATAVGSLLAQICALRADQYFAAPPADAAAGAPAEATIALFKGDGTEAARIEFAGEATPGGARYGRVGGRPGVFLANLPGLWAELQKDPASFAPEQPPAAK